MRAFYQKQYWLVWLYPLSLIYRLIISIRKFLYQKKIFKSHKMQVPVIVVGNITLGGTGKTPFVIWLAQLLKTHGYHPGVISRGYKASIRTFPQLVKRDSDPVMMGDEPVLIATHTGCPVVIDPNRPRAAQYILEHFNCNIIISDDGLQHYALARDFEIVVIDGTRKFGNGWCLPAGPLREPLSRLETVNMIVCNGGEYPRSFKMNYEIDSIINVDDVAKILSGTIIKEQPVHAVAGIGYPEQFFNMLEKQFSIKFSKHIFPDHHRFQQSDFDFAKNEIIVMTEKDAVKCKGFSLRNAYFVKIKPVFEHAFSTRMVKMINALANDT